MPGVTVIICSMVIGILGGDLGIFIGLFGFIVGIYILISQGLFKVFKGIYRIFTKTIEYKQNSQVRKKPVIIEKT